MRPMQSPYLIPKGQVTLSNANIKFPSLLDDGLENEVKQTITPAILVNDLQRFISILQEIINSLTDMIKYNYNTFNSLCHSYKICSYDFVIIIKYLKELSDLILCKITRQPMNKFTTFNDFFTGNEESNIISSQHKEIDRDFRIIASQVAEIENYIQRVYQNQNECGIPLMCYATKYLITLFNKIKQKINSFMSIQNFCDVDRRRYDSNLITFFDVILVLRIARYCPMILHNAYCMDKNDIFNYDENSNRWGGLKRILTRAYTGREEEIKIFLMDAKLQSVKSSLLLQRILNTKSFTPLGKIINAAKVNLEYKIKGKLDEEIVDFEAKENAVVNYDKNFLQDALNLTKIKVFKKIFGGQLPNIALSEKVYLKRTYPEIRLNYIKSLLINIYGREIIERNFRDCREVLREPLNQNQLPLWSKRVRKEDKKYYVSTHLVNNYHINGFLRQNVRGNSGTPDTLLIHIHGGAFYKVHSYFYEKFFREISIDLNIPVLGINYCGIPEHPYPQGLDDCFQMYMWILQNCQNEFGFYPRRLILSGDSAGGAYCLALTFLLIAMNQFGGQNIRLPDLLLPLYPSCKQSDENMSLSMVLSLQDWMLDIKTLKTVCSGYRGYYPNDLDPFLNPVEATEVLLRKIPPSRFLISSYDPLRDDSVRLLDKISQIPGLDVKAYDFYSFPHGFMNQENDTIKIPATNIYLNEIREFLQKTQ